ncbi:MFS transporter [Tsukamurella sp. NPDC003166]|uniref:MFS transporter n=1 Tax=Tsukamurella sp. NPDC003166 TaxID=3154444 RepID=UPI0033AEEAC5
MVVLAFCFLTILADGFDLIIYGATLPSLMAQWGLSKSALANVHSATLAALMVGFLVAGPLADRFGRRVVMLGGSTWFSIMCTACALAPNFASFGFFRIAAGIGLGAVVPSAVALTAEFAPRKNRQLFNGITLTGYPAGGIITALAALAILPSAAAIKAAAKAGAPAEDWRILYGIAAAFLVVVPLMYFLLPESPSYLLHRGRKEEAETIARTYRLDFETLQDEQRAHEAADNRSGYRLVLSRRFLVSTIIFTIIMFCTQVLVYGPNTWLPSMISSMGFGGTQGTMALLMLQIGAAVGTIIGAILVDRGGATKTIVPYFVLGAASLLFLAYGEDIGAVGIFVGAFFAGVGTVGTSTLMYGVIAAHYPTAARSSAIGFTLGLGRFGAILAPQIGAIFATARDGLIAFMVPALIGAVLVLLLAVTSRASGPAARPEQETDPVAAE